MVNELEIVSYTVAFDLFMQVFCKELKGCRDITILLNTSMNQRQIKDAHFKFGEVGAQSGSRKGSIFCGIDLPKMSQYWSAPPRPTCSLPNK